MFPVASPDSVVFTGLIPTYVHFIPIVFENLLSPLGYNPYEDRSRVLLLLSSQCLAAAYPAGVGRLSRKTLLLGYTAVGSVLGSRWTGD